MTASIGRNDNSCITDIEIHIASWNRFAILFEAADRGQGGNVAAKLFGALNGFVINFGIWIIGIAGLRDNKMVDANKPSKIIDMAVGVVVAKAIAKS